jgi:hypothetical protein
MWAIICGTQRVEDFILITMNLGIIGRNQALLDAAVSTAAHLGHSAKGTLNDAQAIAWVAQGSIAGLVIGGGVEQASRSLLLEACSKHGVRPIEVYGPGNLEKALEAL